MSDPYLVAGIRSDPALRTSPGYRSFWTWLLSQDLDSQGWPIGTYSKITVWIDPLRGSISVYDLDEEGTRIPAEGGGYVTHEVAVTLTSQPQNSGFISGDDPI
ncbi:hypothetical protein [Streptosporangium jomthongense]|uniref:Uncharacterized protein n=1 Tax=Streptosporangium jomthongense TaxID=1193683 RepID=A0ABV8FGK5_9ACTN